MRAGGGVQTSRSDPRLVAETRGQGVARASQSALGLAPEQPKANSKGAHWDRSDLVFLVSTALNYFRQGTPKILHVRVSVVDILSWEPMNK